MATRHEGNREEYKVEEDVRSRSLRLQELPHRQEQRAATKQKRPPCPLLGRVGRR